jgi:peptide/nickel transport system substrate-binding protein
VHIRRTTIYRLLAALFALVLLAAACGDSSDPDDAAGGDDEGESTETSADDAMEEGEPVQGGTLSVAATSDGDTLDPLASASFNVHNRVGLASSRLLKPDMSPEYAFGEAPLVGDLAEDWEISEDGLTYTFNLRQGVMWHDIEPVNGREFVAADVVATFEAIQAGGFQAYMLTPVTSIEAPDDYTVVLTLSEPFAPLENYMASHHMWILPQEAFDGGYDPSSQVIGTGPFQMVEWDRGVTTVYERNPNYYEEGIPRVDGVQMPVVADQGARIAAFRANETQLIGAVSPQETESLLSALPEAVLNTEISGSPLMMFFNMEAEPYDQLEVRQAISMAIDREGLGEALFGNGDYTGPVQRSLPVFALDSEELAGYQTYDPEAAEQMLADAGVAGFDMSIMVTAGYGPRIVSAAEWIVEDLAQVGINAEIEVVDYATYIGQRWAGVEYTAAVGLQTPFQEPDEWLYAQYHTDGSRNWWNISDPELDAMVEEQRTILDEDERIAQIQDTQRWMLENLQNPLQVWGYDTEVIVGPTVKGYHTQPQYGFNHYAYLWLEG